MKQVIIEQFGGPEVLRVIDADAPTLRDDEVRVRLEAAAINRVDILTRSGKYHSGGKPPLTLGREGAGVVAEVGAAVSAVAVGERVLAFGGASGFYAEQVAVPQTKLVKLPDGVTFEQASALPTAWLSAWYCLTVLGRPKPGEWALIHAASSSVGDAATQIAKRMGARVIGVTSTSKTAWVEQNGADAVIDRRTEAVVASVADLTAGHGADVVIDAVGGEAFAQSLKAVAPFGRVVALANVTLADSVMNTRDFYPKNASVHGFQITNLMAQRGYDPRPDLTLMLQMISQNELAPHIDKTYPLSKVAETHRRLETNEHIGKLLVEPRRQEGV